MNLVTFRTSRDSLCLREKSLEKWVHRQLGSIDHERRVTQIASKLFDLTWPYHGLGRAERRMLRMAATVHDVGRSIDDDTHPEQGARMLQETAQLPLEADERRGLAYLTRYHRGKVPALGADQILRRSDDAPTLRTILALLRSADALDGRSIERPRLIFEMVGRRLQVTCFLEEDTPKARKVYTRRKKHRLLEELLGCRLDVRIAHPAGLRMVA